MENGQPTKDSQPPELSLSRILDDETVEHLESNKSLDALAEGWDEEATEKQLEDGYCVECEDQPAQVYCESCTDNFCEVCFAAQHRKGTRKQHTTKPLTAAATKAREPQLTATSSNGAPATRQDDEMDVEDVDSDEELERASQAKRTLELEPQPVIGGNVGEWFVERSKYIPMRLTLAERKYLRLLEAALNVSEYTDRVDTIGYGLSKPRRVVQQIRELCAILSGLVLATDYKQGQELFQDRDFKRNEMFFQQLFELGRRYKIMNPDKMRSTYGKLIYLLQDSQLPEVRDLLSFSCINPIRTVYNVLEENNATDILRDDLIAIATKEIISEGRSRRDVQRDIKSKEKAIETLSSRYSGRGLPQEQLRQCLYSVGDNHAFLRVNRDPCDRMIRYLKHYFHPTQAQDSKSSLAIRSGKNGARLSHDHAKQYGYVLQSLTLWREILHDMFHLWSLAEQDLLAEASPYRLRDTGQGLNRVQAAPKTSRMMHAILNRAQKSVGTWIGSSVIHMGDHNVPNALMFIDKYSQIYRILLPITTTLSQIPNLKDNPAIHGLIEEEFGSIDGLIKEILADFFRHGFDGSGADNFYDAGSCIDGRLTSAWNWCGAIEKKRYFPVFLLTGFVGFDGGW